MSDTFNRVIGSLDGLPDVTHTRPTTVTTVHPLIGESQTFVLQTYRQREQGDTIFLQYIDSDGSDRIVIPPKVADAIARQRDALTHRSRSRAAKETAEARAARGEQPAFIRRREVAE
jgi:hypothetical protein